MGKHEEYVVKVSMRLNMNNPQHVKINNIIQNLDSKIFKSRNQFLIDACQFYIDHYGEEEFMKKRPCRNAEYVSVENLDEIKEDLIRAATGEARNEVIRLLGGVISGMNPVLQIERVAEKEEEKIEEDVMDDADVADLAMSWMSKGA